MNKHYNIIIIIGAGGIAEAAGLLLMEWSTVPPTIFIGNRTLSKALKVARWLEEGTTKPCSIKAFHLPEEGITSEMREILKPCLYESKKHFDSGGIYSNHSKNISHKHNPCSSTIW